MSSRSGNNLHHRAGRNRPVRRRASGMLKFYYQGNNPPWVEAVGQFSGACLTEAGANIFVVNVLPGKYADHNTAMLKAAEVSPGWGIHPRDIALVQGNILDVLDAEIATWKAQH